MKKLLIKVLILSSTLILGACHKNPLKENLRQDNVTFLMNASANSEKRLNFKINDDSFGYAYLECMEGNISPEIDCNKLYQAMVVFAKEGHYKGFETLSITDLTDHSVFLILADDYAAIAATNEPLFVQPSLS